MVKKTHKKKKNLFAKQWYTQKNVFYTICFSDINNGIYLNNKKHNNYDNAIGKMTHKYQKKYILIIMKKYYIT